MVVENTDTFARRLIADTMLVGGMVGCRIVVAQMDCSMEVLTHTTGEIVVVKMVVDRMVLCCVMMDFGLCRLVFLLLEKLAAWR